MRHRKSGRRLSRKSNHRKSMFCNMSNSLIIYELIKTTLFKAKELRKFIEPIITISKIDSVSNRRLVFSYLKNKSVVHKLFEEIGPKFLYQPGGYTRILKCGFRMGDNASMAYIEFINRKNKENHLKKR